MALQHFMETLHLRPRLLRSYVGPATSVATVETELVTRAPSQLRRPRGIPFRPRACLCASIAIFRIARASLERALNAQTPLDPSCRFSESASYKVSREQGGPAGEQRRTLEERNEELRGEKERLCSA